MSLLSTPWLYRYTWAIAAITIASGAFQVVFTRMLSPVLAYHFSFLAISLALLGTGAGALLVYLRPALFDGRPLETTLAWWSALYGGLLILIPLVLVDLDYSINDSVKLEATSGEHQSIDLTYTRER